MSWRDAGSDDDWKRLGRPGGDWQGLRPSFDNPMTWALPLFRVKGISIRIHVFFLLFIVITLGQSFGSPGSGESTWFGAKYVAIGLACLFGVVLLHELGHCFACRAVGGSADDVLMWPLGGLAYCMPPNVWRAHMVTVVGGPMVNVVICLIAGPLLGILTGKWIGVALPNPVSPYAAMAAHGIFDSLPLTALFLFNWTSLLLLLFNLLPIFPLDGGRMVQAGLWARVGYGRSMRLAVRVGYIGAILLGIYGAVARQWLVVGIAIFGGVTCYLTHRQLQFTEGMMEGEGEIYAAATWSAADEEEARPTWRDRREVKREARELEQSRADAEEVDEILAKIADEGIESLTARERRTLARATEREQHREEKS